MAFGFGFNKQKVLSAAEKCVQQGKLQNAISEYEKILKHDAKDLTVMNTVGDLHARLGENDKAAECFKNVGDAYASQGFTVKAIAMYKKLSKLKSSTECVLRLAELYTQQGLFNDARAQYLQVAEDFLKSGQMEQAVRIFEKTLEMDPDNVAMRTRLAEVYIRMGKKPEAWKILTAAAESLRAKGQLAAADEILQRMLKLEPGNSYALVLRGRAALEAGDAKAAIESLSRVADLDSNPDALRALFHAYLRTRDFSEAGTLASKLANVHDDGAAVTEYADALLEAQQYREVLPVYEQHADRLLRNDPGKLIESLASISGHVQDDTQALELVLKLYQKAGEKAHLTEVYELLAHAYVQAGDMEQAREYYLKLMQLEPANAMHARNYQQVLEKQEVSNTPHLITAEEGSVLIEELEATAPFVEQRYDDETALNVRAALTDAELFISYNMPGKALDPLLSALLTAPRDLRLNQKLAALHTRASKFAEAAVCCRTLESVYHDAGHAEEAARYGDLAARYEARSAGSADAPQTQAADRAPAAHDFEAAQEFEISAPVEQSAPEPDAPVPAAAPAATTAAKAQGTPSGLFFHASPAPIAPAENNQNIPAEEFSVPAETSSAEHPSVAEIDLSSEWEQDLSVEAPEHVTEAPPQLDEQPQVSTEVASVEVAPTEVQPEPEYAASVEMEPAPPGHSNLGEGIEEVRFYLGQGMIEQADQALAKLEALAPESAELAVLRLGVDSAKQSIPAEPEVSIEEPEAPVEMQVDTEIPTVPAEPSRVQAPQPWPQQRPVLQEMVSEIEQSLGDNFLGTPANAQAEEPAPQEAASAKNEFAPGTLDEFVADLEASLGNDFVPEPAAEPAQPVARVEAPVARAAAASVAPAASAPVAPMPPSEPQHHFAPHVDMPVAPAAPSSHGTMGAGVDLSDMFGELKQELEGEAASTDEDPETHYNLGVAFREMGLLDEAIGEFQKVCQAADHGRAFGQIMQTYTWLAQCFLDKGIPEAAVRWYEKALTLPGLDGETKTALHYELASSLESSGNNSAALSNFLEVYGSNIDYRDVSERIKALRP